MPEARPAPLFPCATPGPRKATIGAGRRPDHSDCTDPGKALWWAARAEAELLLGEYEKAEPTRAKRCGSIRRTCQRWQRRPSTLREQGKNDAALRDINEALTLEPKSIRVLLSSGDLNYVLGHPGLAAADYDAVLDANPNNVRARSSRGTVRFVQGDIQGAKNDFDAALDIDPTAVRADRSR